jgi:hypothetical protein
MPYHQAEKSYIIRGKMKRGYFPDVLDLSGIVVKRKSQFFAPAFIYLLASLPGKFIILGILEGILVKNRHGIFFKAYIKSY